MLSLLLCALCLTQGVVGMSPPVIGAGGVQKLPTLVLESNTLVLEELPEGPTLDLCPERCTCEYEGTTITEMGCVGEPLVFEALPEAPPIIGRLPLPEAPLLLPMPVALLPDLDTCDSSRCDCEYKHMDDNDGDAPYIIQVMNGCVGCEIPYVPDGLILTLIDAYDSDGCQEFDVTELPVAPLPDLDSCDLSTNRCDCEEVDGVMTLMGCVSCMIPDLPDGLILTLVDAYDPEGCQIYEVTELHPCTVKKCSSCNPTDGSICEVCKGKREPVKNGTKCRKPRRG